MAFGFPAFHTELMAKNRSVIDLRAKVPSVLESLGWSIESQSLNQIVAKTKMNMATWGETVTIRFLLEGGIEVSSRCALPTQCFDWGKNKANVVRFQKELGA